MSWVAVDKDGREAIFEEKPRQDKFFGLWTGVVYWCSLPKGSIKKLIGRDLTWEDDCVELK